MSKYFSNTERGLDDGRYERMEVEMLQLAEAIRDSIGRPLRVNSSWRSPEANEAARGSKNSQHLLGRAIDFHIDDQEMGDEIERAAFVNGAKAVGRYNTFIHIDIRLNPHNRGYSYWDNRT